MSEDAGAKQATIDPATGEVVGGLAGLREIIRMKQELASDESAKQLPAEQAEKQSNQSDTATTTKSRRRRNRRRKRKTATFSLPFERQQIIYAEITDDNKHSGQTEVKMFVDDHDRLYVYTPALFTGQEADYRQAATDLLASRDSFDMAKVGLIQIFINRQAEFESSDGSLVYRDEYRIDTANERVYRMVQRLLNNRNRVAAVDKAESTLDDHQMESVVYQLGEKSPKQDKETGVVECPRKELREVAKEVRSEADSGAKKRPDKANDVKSARHGGLVERIVRIREIALKIAATESIDIPEAMEAILLVDEDPSIKLLEQLLEIDSSLADSVIDRLRLMHALGVPREDGTYPVLINSVDELGKDIGYTLQSEVDNFRSVVHAETVRGKKLVYDLDETFMVKIADEYIRQVAEYCRATNSDDIKQLFDSATDEVKLSDVLRVVSGDKTHDALNTAEYDLFHSYVTKYMIAAGWISPNPTDGFPWMQLQVSNTDGLTIDTIRYISANLNWISCVYTDDIILSLAKQLNSAAVPLLHGGRYLQQVLCHEIQQRITALKQETQDGEYRLNPNQLSLTDATESTNIDKDEKSGSSTED